MPNCPRCGEDSALGSGTCNGCGAELASQAGLRTYVISALALVAIIIAAAVLHSYLQSRVVRRPMEFLPATTRLVLMLDIRRGSPSLRTLNQEWSQGDRLQLTARGLELAQQMVDWSGLQLDLRKDALKWLGGEIAIASIGVQSGRSFAPHDLVLVARITDMAKARRELDHSVEGLARAGEWQKSTLRSDGQAITVWGRISSRSEIAYATLDGCLLVGASAQHVDLCMKTARHAVDRLADTSEFRSARARVPSEAFIWCYLKADDLAQLSREVTPALLRGGWLGLVRQYLRPTGAIPSRVAEVGEGGVLAMAVTPEAYGARVRLSYLRAGKRETQGARDQAASRLLQLIPRDAEAFAFVRDVPGAASIVRATYGPGRGPAALNPGTEEGLSMPPDPLSTILQPEGMPQSALVILLPRQGPSRPRLAAALMGGGAEQISNLLAKAVPEAKAAAVANARVVASNEQDLRQIQETASDGAKRRKIEIDDEVMVQLWATQEALSPILPGIEELGFTLRRDSTGAQGELRIETEPRLLLGVR